jgi:ADP-ribose pyrophosphatase
VPSVAKSLSHVTISIVPNKKSPRPKTKGIALVSSELIYKGPAFTVYRDVVREGEFTGQRDIVRHTGSVVVLAIDERKSKRDPLVLLVRQYRYATDKYLWEIPAGRIDAGEKKLPAAKRELREETGVTAKKWSHALHFYASPGFLAEAMDIFLARDLTIGVAQPEDDEQITMRFVPLGKVVQMIDKKQIIDGKTIAATFWLRDKLR